MSSGLQMLSIESLGDQSIRPHSGPSMGSGVSEKGTWSGSSKE